MPFVKQESKKIYEKQIDGRTIPVITPEVISDSRVYLYP